MYAVRSAHPVQEEQATDVVDLVLQRHGLRTVGVDLRPLPGQRELTGNRQTPASGDASGVKDRPAVLATALQARIPSFMSGISWLIPGRSPRRSLSPAVILCCRHGCSPCPCASSKDNPDAPLPQLSRL